MEILSLFCICACMEIAFAGKYNSSGIPTNMGQDHVGLTVPSAQEAADFLINLFDCEFDWEVKRGPAPTAGERGWSDLFGVHPESYMPHVLMLKCGDHHLAQYIELFEWVSPDQEKHGDRGWPVFSDIGHSYVSFTVKDIHATLNYIKKHYPDTRIIQDPPMEFPLRGETCTSTFIVTPWKMWIELAEWSISGPRGRVIQKLRATDDVNDIVRDDVVECNEFHPDIGKNVMDLETPAMIVDLSAFRTNVELMRNRIKARGIDWRPPVKAHKSPELAKVLLENGATGVLVLKVSEAETFADHGIDDIFVANEVVSHAKIRRLANLSKRVRRLRVVVDDAGNLREIARVAASEDTTIEVLVDVNVNMNRCGVHPPEAVELAKLVVELESTVGGVKFMGIFGYEGHTPVLPPNEKTKETKLSHEILRTTRELIEAEGIMVAVVTGGGSCNYIDALNTGVLTEIQAGGGALSDRLYVDKAHLGDHGHIYAVFVLTQIMSSPGGGRAMGDAGFKSLGWHPFGGLPLPFGRDDVEVYGLSAEHGKFRAVKKAEEEEEDFPLRIGDKLLLVPGYVDAMGLLHRQIYAVEDGVVKAVWKVAASGDIE